MYWIWKELVKLKIHTIAEKIQKAAILICTHKNLRNNVSKIDQSQSGGMNDSENLSRIRWVYKISYPGDGPQRAQVPVKAVHFYMP